MAEPGEDTVRAEHLGFMLTCAVRYALGGRTHVVVADVADMVRTYWSALPGGWRTVIADEVRLTLLRNDLLPTVPPSRCVHETWRELVDWMGASDGQLLRPAGTRDG